MLLLIRHAQAQPAPDLPSALWPLTPDGRADAASLARRLPPVGRVLASGERKAIETAEPIAARHGLAVECVPELGELTRPWSGSHARYAQAVARCFAKPDTPAAQGWETAAGALARFSAAVLAAAAPEAMPCAVVAHGMVLSLYRAHLLGLTAADLAAWQAMAFPAWAIADPVACRLVADFRGLGETPAALP